MALSGDGPPPTKIGRTTLYRREAVLAFVSLRDNLDLGTPSGLLMFQIFGAMAEF